MARAANHKEEYIKVPDYGAIGEMLQHTREGCGVSVEQAARTLHIRPAFILALEKGRLEDITGGPVYAKGYLRMYAGYLGIDLATMLSLLSPEAEVRPIASLSRAQNEPKRTRMAVVISVAVMVAAALGLWVLRSPSDEEAAISLVKPLPQELHPYLGGQEDESAGLDSPCIREAAHPSWPPCYAEAEERLLRKVQGTPRTSIMQAEMAR